MRIGILLAAFSAIGALTAQGSGPTLTMLYFFPRGANVENYPAANVIFGLDGALFGTTNAYGYGWGAVYELIPPATSDAAWAEQTLYSFKGAPDGAAPTGSLALSSTGMLYGTTEYGASSNVGTVFQLTP